MTDSNVTPIRSRTCGPNLNAAKLTEGDVRQARQEYAEGMRKIQALQRHYSVQGLADRFGVSKAAMEKALSGRTWGHVR